MSTTATKYLDDLDTFIRLRYGDITSPDIVDKLSDSAIARIFSISDANDTDTINSGRSLLKSAFNNPNDFPRTLKEYKIAIRCFLQELHSDDNRCS